jgi:MSHA pilin protein MshC
VELSVSGAGYALHQRAGGCTTGAFTRDVPSPAGSEPFAGAPPSGVALFASDPFVVFDARGRAKPGGVTVTVEGRSFIIVGESGYVNEL